MSVERGAGMTPYGIDDAAQAILAQMLRLANVDFRGKPYLCQICGAPATSGFSVAPLEDDIEKRYTLMDCASGGTICIPCGQVYLETQRLKARSAGRQQALL